MYTPKIKPEYIQALYKLKHSFNKPIPMTTLVNTAVKEFLINRGGELHENHSTSTNTNQNSFENCESFEERISG